MNDQMQHLEYATFTEDLHTFQDAESAADLRTERIKACAEDMLLHDEEYNPWGFKNFSEAMGNMPDAAMLTICAGCGAAIVDGKMDNESGNYVALGFIRTAVTDYWRKIAVKEAEKMEDRA